MKGVAIITLAALALSACRDTDADLPPPVEMTAETLGYYCQMALLEHDGPKGQIHLDGAPAPVFFSQVRDALGYLRMPEQSHAVRAAYVQDMTGAESWDNPGGWIRADSAVYVVGSDSVGGMGAPEIVPFSEEAAAQAFAREHGGVIRRFAEIAAADVLGGDTAPMVENSEIATRLKALSQPEEER